MLTQIFMNIFSRMRKDVLSDIFVRHTLTLMSGTIGSQTIAMAVMPILTRIYSPEDYGYFAVFSSIVSVLLVVIGGRYELAIVIPDDDFSASNIMALSLVICVLSSIAIIVVITLFGNIIVSAFGISSLWKWIWILPVTLLSNGIYQSFYYWSVRRQTFKLLSMRQLVQSILTSFFQISGSRFLWMTNSGGLLVGAVVGQFCSMLLHVYHVLRSDKELILRKYTPKDLLEVAAKYSEYPRYLCWGHLLNSLSPQIPIFLLTYFYSPEATGWFSLSTRAVGIPMMLIGTSVSQVFYSTASKEYRSKGNCSAIYSSTLKKLFWVGVIPFLSLAILAPVFIPLLFGEKWGEAGWMVTALSPMYFFRFLGSPVSSMFMIAAKQKQDLIWQHILIILSVSSFLLGINFFDNPLGAIVCYSLSYSLFFMINIFMSWQFAQGR